MLLALLVAISSPSAALSSQMDRTFICPENLPDDASRRAQVELFLRQAMAAGYRTPAEIADLRLTMLRKHGCRVARQ